MAGVNQHYISQFLQRGFASHKVGKSSFVWEFRADGTNANNKTKEVGAEDQFGHDTVVDDTITTAENHYANLVNRLRVAPAGPVIEPAIPDFLAHLEVRTRNLRYSFLGHSEFLVTKLLEYLATPQTVEAIVRKQLQTDEKFLRAELAKFLRTQPSPPRDINGEINKLMRTKSIWLPQLLTAMTPHFVAMAAALAELPPVRLSAAAKAAHVRALKISIHPPLRAAAFASLQFRVAETDVNLILGDSGSLFELDTPTRFRPYTDKDDIIVGAFLPLTPRRLLIGEATPKPHDFALLKRQMARCSREFFIAHENTAENVALQPEIGRDAAILSATELEAIAMECLRDFTT